MERRTFLAMASALAATWKLDPAIGARPAGTSLRSRAAAKGVQFGCAVNSWDLWRDKAFAAAVAREAGIVVPEGELKRGLVQIRPGAFDFSGADHIADFARDNGQAMRGHTFCWYTSNPPWLEAALRSGIAMPAKRALLTDYIEAAMAHFRGRITAWDVCNEVVAPDDGSPDGMRIKNNVWQEVFTERYIDIAFQTARAADPSVTLYLNDFGIESAVAWQERKRTAILRLLDRLKRRNVPIDAFGIQCHMKPYKEPFDQDVFAKFLHDLSGYGLKLAITELDFLDRGGPDDPARRDADMAAAAKSLLDVALDNQATVAVLTWGLTDNHSWLNSKWVSDRWPDGQLSRGLPLDAGLRAKPLYRAIADAFDQAPPRSAGRHRRRHG